MGGGLPGRGPDIGPRTAEITTLYVDPAQWRTGTGRALMDAVLAFLAEDDWLEVALWVLEDNARARGFYEACGFMGDGSRQRSGATGPHGAGAASGPSEVRMRRSV